jgi:apolipoprotein N-acyltransferase
MSRSETRAARFTPLAPAPHLMNVKGGWPGHLLALLCGLLTTFSLAPFFVWPLGIAASALLLATLHGQHRRVILWRCWLFGVGLFGSGTSWVYVSIQQHGNAPAPLATFLVFLFTALLALFTVMMGLLYSIAARPRHRANASGLVFAACWTLCEWLRCWLLTGFPWLFLGNAHLTTPLSGWAPVTGVLGISFVVALTGAALYQAISSRGKGRWHLALAALALWLCGWALQQSDWVEPAGAPLQVVLIQPNIAQSDKWQAEEFNNILRIYEQLSAPAWGADLVIWPEAAIPRLYQYIPKRIARLDRLAHDNASTLITGIPYRLDPAGDSASTEQTIYYNSVIALGEGSGAYFKQRLVPFGEYVPLEHWLRGIIGFFDLPMSHMSWGPARQEPINAGPWQLAPFICYEVVYPDMVARDSANAHFIVNVSNDSWFGHSIGPLQHFQIARMRALENGRYLLRGTNNGITAIIDHRGRVLSQAEQFTRTTVSGQAIPMRGQTPFSRLGSLPVISVCLLIVLIGSFGIRIRPNSPG